MMMRKTSLMCVLLATLLLLGTTPEIASAVPDSRMGNARWGANYFPNVSLTTHDGKTVRFFDDLIRDKVVVINFIYTTCPDTCPLETAKLLEVHRILGDRVGKDVFFYSITIDPETDTPEVLKKYVELFNVGPGWTFLTGKEDDIITLRKKFGLYIEDIQDGSLNHNVNMIIGNQATGRWMKSSPFENPYFLAREIGAWLHNWKIPRAEKFDYSDAPKLRDLDEGETLYRTRCAACHTIGGGDIVELEQRRVGPDLFGVVQSRDREWLGRWLSAPDKMLREKDPIAMALLAKYKNLPMPNMRLSEVDVARVISYMDKESRRVEKVRQMQAMAPKNEDGEAKSCCSRKKKNAAQVAESTETAETAKGTDDTEPRQATLDLGETPAATSPQDGFVTPSMAGFGVLGFSFLLLARIPRRTR